MMRTGLVLVLALAAVVAAREVHLQGEAAESFLAGLPQANTNNGRVSYKASAMAEAFGRTEADLKYQQFFGDAKVLGGQFVVTKTAEGATSVSGQYFEASELEAKNTVRIAAAAAAQMAIFTNQELCEDVTASSLVESGKAALNFDAAQGKFFFRVQLPMRYEVWVDADSAEITNEFQGLPTLVSKSTEESARRATKTSAPAPKKKGALAPGSGIDHLGNVVDMIPIVTSAGGTNELRREEGHFRQINHDFANRAGDGFLADLFGGLNQIQFQRMMNQGDYGDVFADADNAWDLVGIKSPAQDAGVSVAESTRQVFNYAWDFYGVYLLRMLNVPHTRNIIHTGKDFFNAFYMGDGLMGYGDGIQGVSHEVVGADVICHELFHGVTDSTSGLIYQDESGALNEAFSDIGTVLFERTRGATVEDSYLIGEEILYAPLDDSFAVNALRDMSNPLNTGNPSHWLTRYTGNEDNGGVHINSNIINHFFYLLVEGGKNADASVATANGVQNTLPLEDASEYILQVMTELPENASFCVFRNAAVNNAPSEYVTPLVEAFDEVGLTDTLC